MSRVKIGMVNGNACVILNKTGKVEGVYSSSFSDFLIEELRGELIELKVDTSRPLTTLEKYHWAIEDSKMAIAKTEAINNLIVQNFVKK